VLDYRPAANERTGKGFGFSFPSRLCSRSEPSVEVKRPLAACDHWQSDASCPRRPSEFEQAIVLLVDTWPCVEGPSVDGVLAKGRFYLDRRFARLHSRLGEGPKSLPCSLLAAVDNLAPADAVKPLFNRWGTAQKRLLLFGAAYGQEIDYGHDDLVIGKNAKAEVYPAIRQWLEFPAGIRLPAVRLPDRIFERCSRWSCQRSDLHLHGRSSCAYLSDETVYHDPCPHACWRRTLAHVRRQIQPATGLLSQLIIASSRP